MSEEKKHGGFRPGSGRKGKTEADKLRSRLWYTLIALSVGADANTPPSVVGQMVKAEADRLAPHLAKKIGSTTAYNAYCKGESVPDKPIAANVDKLLAILGVPSFSWVLSKPGQIKLTPVWAWSPFLSMLSPESVILCAKIENIFWKRIAPSVCVPELLAGGPESEFPSLAHPKVEAELTDLYESEPNIKWPPLLLLPTDFVKSKSFPPKEGLPYSSYFDAVTDNTPRTTGPSDLERLQYFSNWSRSTLALMAGGNEWLEMIRTCLEPPMPIDLLMWPPDGRKHLMRDIAEILEIKYDDKNLELSPTAAILARFLLSYGDIIEPTGLTGFNGKDWDSLGTFESVGARKQ